MKKYEEMLELDRPISKHKAMSLSERAAQFAPFAALNGHAQALLESERQTEDWIELDETVLTQINEQLNQLALQVKNQPWIKMTYFQPDEYKYGGQYICVDTQLLKIDEMAQQIVIKGNIVVPMKYIMSIEQ